MKNYKSLIYALTVVFSMVFLSCEEEERGPLVSDNTIPSVVTELTAENLPGGAKLQYKVPNEEDILFVEATFERNGKLVSSRASIYKNSISIEGLKATTPQEIKVRTVDRSNNFSEPVTVTITPLKAPIDKLLESFEFVPAFGGVRLLYNNEDNIQAELLLYTIAADGRTTYNQSAFIQTNNLTGYTYRFFESVPQKFGVVAIDRWDNITVMHQATITPLEEFELDRTLFETNSLPTDAESRFGWVESRLIDGNIGSGFHTDQTWPGAVVPPYTQGYHMITIDLGQLAKLSRLKFWQRQGSWVYRHGNTHYFEIWGIDEIPADNGATFDGWTKLVENGEVIKPSGLPLNSFNSDDSAAAAAGHEFDVNADAPPVRYIRFVQIESWSETKFLHLMEIAFWGQPR